MGFIESTMLNKIYNFVSRKYDYLLAKVAINILGLEYEQGEKWLWK